MGDNSEVPIWSGLGYLECLLLEGGGGGVPID
jgi:hypothetical protein